MNPTLSLILKLLVSGGLVALLLCSNGLQQPLAILSHVSWWVLPMGVGIYLSSQLISAYRWQFLARALGFHLRFRELYEVYLLGMFVSLFLPGSIGGDVARMLHLAKRTERPKREALLTLLAERGVGLAALLAMMAVFCLTPVAAVLPLSLRVMVWMMLGGVLTAGLLLQLPNSLTQLERIPLFRQGKAKSVVDWLLQAKIFWSDLPLLGQSVSLSILVHGFMVLIHLSIAHALGLGYLSWMYIVLVYGLVGLASVLPIAFNGLGVREGAYVMLLHLAGVPTQTGLAFAMLWLAISTATSLVGGIVFLKGPFQGQARVTA